ncbi:fatty-acyl-CoA synthase [Natronocella acetinitrilica]|uniref:Fatty-acyl-CoA synthase n=1 Tax=Natronocella acetinitrilica TaxID=414046 RepID=A0AAE3G728_9GAMM|nr:AMP-binding protein [Natronocella acetinitrilica]MCP1676253.1 fatty-acyl-CoA synthase [Natronocella acetinitrilica]
MTTMPNPDDLPMDWVGNWIGPWARRYPGRQAVYDAASGAHLSYAELNDKANRMAEWLTDELGMQPGEVVCLLCRNRLEALYLYLACGKLGLIMAPLSYRLRPRELNDLLSRMAPAALLYEAAFDDLAGELELPDSLRQRYRLSEEGQELAGRLAAQSGGEQNRSLPMSATYLYIHTGGTTATPKVCVVPYRQMIWNSFDLMVAGGGTRDARELITFPFFHIGGWNSLTPILHGGGYAVLMRQFDPGELLRLIDQERIRHFGGVEAMFRFIQQHPDYEKATLQSLEGITSAGAPCAQPVMDAFLDRGIAVTQAYGLTEAGPSNFINAAWDEDLEQMRGQTASIGTAMPHCDYRLVDQETGEPVTAGETGVLCMRSLHHFGGYLGDTARTAKAIDDAGWVWSGDLAVEDEDGMIRIVGRADNMFVSGGENVSPEEIETVLAGHASVTQAGVVAVADDRWGQVAVAAVVAPDAESDVLLDDLRRRCSQELAAFKRPREIRVVEGLPLTGAGKLDRSALAALFASPDSH